MLFQDKKEDYNYVKIIILSNSIPQPLFVSFGWSSNNSKSRKAVQNAKLISLPVTDNYNIIVFESLLFHGCVPTFLMCN